MLGHLCDSLLGAAWSQLLISFCQLEGASEQLASEPDGAEEMAAAAAVVEATAGRWPAASGCVRSRESRRGGRGN